MDPQFFAPLVKSARTRGQCLIFVHTHLGNGAPSFSKADDAGEAKLSPFLESRLPGVQNFALLITSEGCLCRVISRKEYIEVLEVGQHSRFLSVGQELKSKDLFDRQIRAFGAEGQARIQNLNVGIIGLGGTGSLVAQQLAHLGVERFMLLDFDYIECTNLNRTAGATPTDVGRAKVEVASDMILRINPAAMVECKISNIIFQKDAAYLGGLDFLFCCTDSQASRAILCQLAYQYLIPTIDLGVSITAKEGSVSHITGRVQLLAPGLGCLTCGNLLDSEAIRREMLTPEQRQADRYISGAQEPQPSVMSLNSTVAALAVSMFLGTVTEIPFNARYQIYNGVLGSLKTALLPRDAACIVCSPRGALARGDSWELPTRKQ
jgi:molybdopterin/thiamine biosynthesis adenylyltransferase